MLSLIMFLILLVSALQNITFFISHLTLKIFFYTSISILPNPGIKIYLLF